MNDATEIYGPPPIPDHQLMRVIGRGSYGEVWLARNVMGTPRAVKVVKRHDFDYARPFDREFEGIQRYEPVSRSHEGLVHALHVGQGKDDEYFYYVMELADDARGPHADDGEPQGFSLDYRPRTLRDEISRLGALPVAECIELGMVLAGALGHLHKHGLVHRDVKPSNIIYVNGRPKLADVGLVARVSDTRSIVGTDGYVAPEGTGQPRSDVFSLGKVLYESLTGNDRMSFPDVPESWTGDAEGKARFELLEIVLRAGDADPKRRYTDTAEMLADLAMLQAGKSLRQMRRMETRLRRAMQVLAFAALGAALAGGAWMLERHRRQDIQAAEQEARTARAEKQHLLGESLVAQARSERKSGEAGAREKALSAALRANVEGAPLLDVRTQAASALGLFDIGEFSAAWPADRPNGTRTVASDDGHFMATASEPGKFIIYERNAEAGEVVCVIEDRNVHSVADLFLSAEGRWLAVQTRSGRLLGYNAQTGARVWEIPTTDEPTRPAFVRDATWLALGTARGMEAVEAATGKRVVLVPGAPKMRQLTLAPDGTWMAALASGEMGFRIYTGLPGGMPDEAVKVKDGKLDSDMELNGPGISGDSRYLAAAVGEDRLRVWAMPGGEQIAWLRGHQRTVRSTTFHPYDSSIVASTSYDGTVRLWDIPTRQQILTAPAGGEYVTFVPDRGEILLRNWAGDAVRAAPFHAKRAMRVLMLPPGTPFGLFSGVTFSNDGKLVAAAGDAGVLVWVLDTGQIVRVGPAEKYVWRGVRFSPDGKNLWVTSGRGLYRNTVAFSDAGTLRIGPQETIKEGRYRELAWVGERIAVSHGLFPAEGARDGQISFIGPDGSTETVNVPHFSDMLAVSADGRWVASSNYPHPFGSLIDMQSKERAPLRIDAPSRCTFAFLPNQSLLAIGSDRDIRFQPLPGSSATAPPPLHRTFSEFIPARFALSPDGNLLAASTGAAELSLFDARTLTRIATLDSPLTPFDFSLEFSQDGSHLALAGGVSRVVVWDLGWLKQELAQRGLAW